MEEFCLRNKVIRRIVYGAVTDSIMVDCTNSFMKYGLDFIELDCGQSAFIVKAAAVLARGIIPGIKITFLP